MKMSEPASLQESVSSTFEPEGVSAPSGLGCLVIVARQQGLELSIEQLVRDNLLAGQEVSVSELIRCAKSAGMRAKAVKLDWSKLTKLGKALPAIVRFMDGTNM